MVLRMNATIRKVLREVLMGLLITEPTWKGGKLVEEDDDLEQKGFRVGVDLCLGAMRSLSERERERERAQNYNPKQIDRKKKGTYAWTCDVLKIIASWVQLIQT